MEISKLDVLIRVQDNNVYMQYKGEWVPLNTKLLESGFSLKSVIIFKLIALKDF